jgi:two-component system sensor histidine kinase AgrC
MLNVSINIIVYLLAALTIAYISHQLNNKKGIILNKNKIFLIASLSSLFAFSSYFFNGIEKPIISLLLIIVFVKLFFKNDWVKTIIISFFSYIIYCFCEIIFGLIIISFTDITNEIVFNNIFYMFLFNIIVDSLAFSLININMLKQKLIQAVNFINQKRLKTILAISLLMMLGISINMYKNIINNTIEPFYIYNCILSIVLMLTAIIIINEIGKGDKMTKKFDDLLEHMESYETIMEQEKIKRHEDKNQLIVINSLINEDNKKLKKYMKNILEEIEHSECDSINNLNYIPKGGLKGLIYYKIIEMQGLGIEVNIDVSKRIEDLDLENIKINTYKNISKIIGVFLDNAKEAAVDSEDKIVGIEIYNKADSLCLCISNSFDGNLHIENFGKKKFTTKGKGRGYGLKLVENIIQKEKIISERKEIVNNFYIQHLKIKIKEKE